MFQSNAAKEVLYIFLWLVGIIFFYALVHTFILEPSQNKSEISHTKQTLQSQITHPNKHLVSSEKIPAKTNIEKTSITTMPEKIKTSIQKPLKNKTNIDIVEKKELQAVKPETISIPSIPKVVETPQNKLSTPSIPNVPSIPTLPSVKKVAEKQHTIETVPAKITTVDTEKVMSSKKETPQADAVEKVLSKDIDVKRIETSRQQVRQEAEDIRKEAIKLLGL